MYYIVTLWKDVKTNDEAKKHAQELFAIANKTDFGVLNFRMQAEQGQAQPVEQDPQQYYQEGEPQ